MNSAKRRRAPATGRCVVYVLSCADGTLYTGWTTDLSRRVAAHRRGVGARYTRGRLPCELRAWWEVADRREALRDEARFKRLSRGEKLRALAVAAGFRASLRRPPLIAEGAAANATARPKGRRMPTHTRPEGAELRALADEARTHQARITTAKGDIVFRFYADDAPAHCAAFIKLARAGFYDGLTFHRVEPGFVIQGGDPAGNGTGGPGYRLDAEFNERPHVKGTVAMARAQDPNSAGSQFYICLADARFLDRQYTVFGQVVEGQDVVDRTRVGDVMQRVTIEPIAA